MHQKASESISIKNCPPPQEGGVLAMVPHLRTDGVFLMVPHLSHFHPIARALKASANAQLIRGVGKCF